MKRIKAITTKGHEFYGDLIKTRNKFGERQSLVQLDGVEGGPIWVKSNYVSDAEGDCNDPKQHEREERRG